MYSYPNCIKKLIDCLKKLPSVGEKSAERMALALIEMENEQLENFAQSLMDVERLLQRCHICNNFAEEEICEICSDESRTNGVLCVVENPQNVVLFEKTGSFNGKYHVLNGLISPMDGVSPEQINIKNLKDRILNESINEIIIAVKPSIEGETTALYISKMLKDTNVLITKIASGIPIGTDMEYIDTLTLEMALEDRKRISSEG